MKSYKSFALMLTVAPLLAAVPTGAAPLLVDINSEGRADMRTVGWENWQPSGGNMSQSFGGVTVTLRAGGDGGSVSLSGKKSLLVYGVTLGAEGVVATGGTPVVMEILLEGLAPGPHTFVGYHHALGGAAGTYTVSAGDSKIEGIEPSREPRHNDEVGTSFIAFEAKAGEPVVIRIAAASGDRVLLNGFALDVTEPRKKALKPLPANYERHADYHDGMPDKWETAKGLNPNDAADRNHVAADGYTMLEQYLNSIK